MADKPFRNVFSCRKNEARFSEAYMTCLVSFSSYHRKYAGKLFLVSLHGSVIPELTSLLFYTPSAKGCMLAVRVLCIASFC